MTIASVVARGYGNGTFSGTVSLVVARGYGIGEAVSGASGERRLSNAFAANRMRDAETIRAFILREDEELIAIIMALEDE